MIEKIVLFSNKSDCCGCGACVNVCSNESIRMEIDEEGFEYPVIDENSCVQCQKCLKVCPLKAAGTSVEKDA